MWVFFWGGGDNVEEMQECRRCILMLKLMMKPQIGSKSRQDGDGERDILDALDTAI